MIVPNRITRPILARMEPNPSAMVAPRSSTKGLSAPVAAPMPIAARPKPYVAMTMARKGCSRNRPHRTMIKTMLIARATSRDGPAVLMGLLGWKPEHSGNERSVRAL